MALLEVIKNLKSFNSEYTIYASKPWMADSQAVVEYEPDDGSLPSSAKKHRLEYFLEIFILQDFVADRSNSLTKPISNEEICERVIEYATNDA